MFEYYLTHKHYHTLDYYFKNKYGKKVFKISLNASFTCPNRDGTKGYGGCLFCSEEGSGDFAGNPKDSIQTQFEKIKNIMEKKWPDAYYIVYFQAYSNTYGSIERLKEVFEPFIGQDNVIGLSIATRCDCIHEEIARYLFSLKLHFKEFWIELGLQTTKRSTMKLLNLKYTFTDFKKTVKLLHNYHMDIIVHIIDGLPYESKEDQIQTILKLNSLPIQGIKIHNLNILKNTALATMYLKNQFKILNEQEFIEIVALQLAYLKENILVHRIGADSDEKKRIAPDYVKKKMAVVDHLDLYMEEVNLFQGDFVQQNRK